MTPAELDETIVFVIARATATPSPGFEIVNWEPPLKARKPNIRIKPPRAASYKRDG